MLAWFSLKICLHDFATGTLKVGGGGAWKEQMGDGGGGCGAVGGGGGQGEGSV